MVIGIVGASGLVGGEVCRALEANGHQWVGFSRSPSGRSGDWRALEDGFEGLDGLVNVAGDSIDKRWTENNKKRFHQSRIGVTQQIVEQLERMPAAARPKVLLNASAVGIYGDQGSEPLTESSPAGKGYLANLCQEWEAAALPAQELGIRVVLGRIGVVLGKESAAWRRMKLIFQLGGGGPLGNGNQYWPIVHLSDVGGGILYALENTGIAGPLNLVSPATVTNAHFTQVLGSVLRRPAFLPVPRFALRLLLGEFSSALLESYRAVPQGLQAAGYEFRFSEIRAIFEELK